jgi:hypothetical protein
MLLDDAAKALYAFLSEHPDFSNEPAKAAELQPIGDYVKILLLQYEELYETVEPNELRYEADRLHGMLIEQYVKMQKQRLVSALQSSDEAETNTILEEVKQLDNLLKTHKGGA